MLRRKSKKQNKTKRRSSKREALKNDLKLETERELFAFYCARDVDEWNKVTSVVALPPRRHRRAEMSSLECRAALISVSEWQISLFS